MSNEYLLDGDREVIERWAAVKNVYITFRPAGQTTLDCLRRGAAAKPHSILDKTIKEAGEIQGAAPANFPASCEKFSIGSYRDFFVGFVGYRENGQLKGVYLSSRGEKVMKTQQMPIKSVGRHSVLLLEESKDQLGPWIRSQFGDSQKKTEYHIFSCFYTGDYDVHDLLQLKYKVPSGRDGDFIQSLQKELLAKRDQDFADCKAADEVREEYQRVQHGAQANYIAQMINDNLELITKGKLSEETINYIADKPSKISVPVYALASYRNPKEWKELKTELDVTGFYEQRGTRAGMAWISEAEREKHIEVNISIVIRSLKDKGLICETSASADDAYQVFVEKYPGMTQVSDYTKIDLKKVFAKVWTRRL